MAYVQCELCPRYCRLDEGQRGDCLARMNKNGKMQTLVYGNPCSVHVDPVEKKPLFHVLPESNAFSIATAGCNLHCKFCQNWQISQSRPEDLNNYTLSPEQIIEGALKGNCKSVAYTYTEPIIFYEYMYDISRIAHNHGLLNLMITAGYINPEPLRELCPQIDASNVDLKGITDEYYRKMCFATLAPVQNTLVTMQKEGVWVEITNLVVPTWNDNETDIRELCRWVVQNMGRDVPIHFSRFWPMHQLQNLPPTPVEKLSAAWDIAKSEGVRYPYVGNVPGHNGNHTYCPQCEKALIKRKGYAILENHITNGKCNFCRTSIPGIWN